MINSGVLDFVHNFQNLYQKMPKKRIHKDRSTDTRLRQEIVLNVIARYIAMVANGWTPKHLRGISKK